MTSSLGEFEYLLLLALLGHERGATAAGLRRTLKQAGRSTTRGALYATLDRLGEKGLIRWHPGKESPERGGSPARMVKITPAGFRLLKTHHQTIQKLADGEMPLEWT